MVVAAGGVVFVYRAVPAAELLGAAEDPAVRARRARAAVTEADRVAFWTVRPAELEALARRGVRAEHLRLRPRLNLAGGLRQVP